jgi:hypothetical protein
MRVLIALLVIVYLVGVGVALAPTIKANWSIGPASQFVESVARNCRERCLGRRRHIAALQSSPVRPSSVKRESDIRPFGRLRRPFWIEQEGIVYRRHDRKYAQDGLK